MNYLIKHIRLTWALISISLLSTCVNFMHAQRSNTKAVFIERINASLDPQNNKNSDSIYNILREEAWALKASS
jgi:hypothetical protein